MLRATAVLALAVLVAACGESGDPVGPEDLLYRTQPYSLAQVDQLQKTSNFTATGTFAPGELTGLVVLPPEAGNQANQPLVIVLARKPEYDFYTLYSAGWLVFWNSDSGSWAVYFEAIPGAKYWAVFASWD